MPSLSSAVYVPTIRYMLASSDTVSVFIFTESDGLIELLLVFLLEHENNVSAANKDSEIYLYMVDMI